MLAHGVSRGFDVNSNKPGRGDTMILLRWLSAAPAGALGFFQLPTAHAVG